MSRKALLWAGAGAVVLVAALVLVSLLTVSRPAPPTASPTPPPMASGTTKGSPQAAVTIVEFSDFQ